MLVSQELVFEVPLDEQVQLSTQIIEGKVISKESFWDETHSNILTRNIVKVHRIFKGEVTDTLEIITPGGIVDLEAEVVSHSLHLQKGDIGLFLLSKANSNITSKGLNNSKSFKSVSNEQGFYKYNVDENFAVNAFSKIEGIANNLYNKIEDMTLTSSKVLEDIDWQSQSMQSRTSSSKMAAPSISSFSASNLSAGTRSVLTINGSGFGSTQGTVGFSDADYGGYLHTNALDNQIISWTDTKIQVEIPDIAGTGTFKVNTSSNGSVTSSTNLLIHYAQTNLVYSNSAYQTQHIDDNGTGGYTWHMSDAFKASGAEEAFKRAFENWSCSTGINWDISSQTTTASKNASDGINVIGFDSTMGTGTLGQCYSRYQGCYDNGQIKWYVTEMDIVFNPSKNWNYSTSPPTSNQVDFETVTVHELGHGHQLSHVIDTNVVMHYSISSGESLRTLSEDDLFGAGDVQSRSTTTTICGQLSMEDASCAQLGIDDFDFEDVLAVYPNPSNNYVYIKSKAGIGVNNITLFNLQGREVYNSKLTQKYKSSHVINVERFAKGMYLVKIDTDLGIRTEKIIVN